ECICNLQDGAGVHSVRCGFGKWIDGETTMPGMPPKLTRGRGSEEGVPKGAAAAAWKDPDTLEMRWQFYETPHHATVTCRFTNDRKSIELTLRDSMAEMSNRPPNLTLKGRSVG